MKEIQLFPENLTQDSVIELLSNFPVQKSRTPSILCIPIKKREEHIPSFFEFFENEELKPFVGNENNYNIIINDKLFEAIINKNFFNRKSYSNYVVTLLILSKQFHKKSFLTDFISNFNDGIPFEKKNRLYSLRGFIKNEQGNIVLSDSPTWMNTFNASILLDIHNLKIFESEINTIPKEQISSLYLDLLSIFSYTTNGFIGWKDCFYNTLNLIQKNPDVSSYILTHHKNKIETILDYFFIGNKSIISTDFKNLKTLQPLLNQFKDTLSIDHLLGLEDVSNDSFSVTHSPKKDDELIKTTISINTTIFRNQHNLANKALKHFCEKLGNILQIYVFPEIFITKDSLYKNNFQLSFSHEHHPHQEQFFSSLKNFLIEASLKSNFKDSNYIRSSELTNAYETFKTNLVKSKSYFDLQSKIELNPFSQPSTVKKTNKI